MIRRRLLQSISNDWEHVIECNSLETQTTVTLDIPLGIDTIAGHQYRLQLEYEWEFFENGPGTYHEFRFPYTYDISSTYGKALRSSESGSLDWTFTARKSMLASTMWTGSTRYISGILKIKNYTIEEVGGLTEI